MKLSFALTATMVTGAFGAKTITEVKADSKFGMDLLSKARNLEEGDEADTTWVSGYALKFQGCHHIAQWNAAADGEDDVKIETKRLAKFRLCPVSTCSDNSGGGCKNGFGDYIVDMDEFLLSYIENKEEVEQQECENYAANYCSCEDNGDDQYDEQACLQNCYGNASMSQCIEQEEGDDNQQGYYNNGVNYDEVTLENYSACAQYAAGRRLDEADGDDNGNGEIYIGPYCSDQGGEIVLGAFTDDACTEFADDYGGQRTFKSLTGSSLPYSSESIVDTKCYTCEEQQEGDDDQAEAEVKEMCTTAYTAAGKCERYLNNYYVNGNNNGCAFMEGIKTTRSNGTIINGKMAANKVASAFIGIFSISFVALGSYVYYLKTKLDRGSINLSD